MKRIDTAFHRATMADQQAFFDPALPDLVGDSMGVHRYPKMFYCSVASGIYMPFPNPTFSDLLDPRKQASFQIFHSSSFCLTLNRRKLEWRRNP
jgi:hypothetical protein